MANINPKADRPDSASAEYRAFLKEQADEIIWARGMPLWARPKKPKRGKRPCGGGAGVRTSGYAVSADQGVYVIGAAGEPIKIGIAQDVDKRVATLQTGHPHRLIVFCHIEVADGRAHEVEKLCHQHLADYRLSGEWFDYDPFDAVDLVRSTTERLTTR